MNSAERKTFMGRYKNLGIERLRQKYARLGRLIGRMPSMELKEKRGLLAVLMLRRLNHGMDQYDARWPA